MVDAVFLKEFKAKKIKGNMEFEIKKAIKKDARRISNLIRDVIRNINYGKFSAKQLSSWQDFYSITKIEEIIDRGVIFIGIEKNKIIATISLIDENVYGLYVKPRLMKRGIGTKMMEFIEKYARQKGIRKLFLSSTPVALKFYQGLKYKQKGKVRINFGQSHFVETKMEKILK
jgi:GNAT superfamily N-acetyltransferase